MNRFHVSDMDGLRALIDEVGFLPLGGAGALPGFSLAHMTAPESWHTGDPETDPWEWRQILAAEGSVVYGKFIERKNAFVSKAWFPVLANWRRDGYDYDSLQESGLANWKQTRIMSLFDGGGTAHPLPAHELKRLAGFGKDGLQGFDGAVTALEMRTYLVFCGVQRKRNRAGEEYGWPVSLFAPPELLYGAEYVRSCYGEPPAASLRRILEHLNSVFPTADEKQLERFLKA